MRDPRTYRGLVPEQVHAGRNLSKATLKFYRVAGRPIALKDYGDRPFLIRNTVGRYFARREARAYRSAAGVLGLPAFHGRVGAFALALDWIDARPLSALPLTDLDPDFCTRLRRIVEDLHQRGIAAGDLHHRDVLVGRDGTIHLVDLAAACDVGYSPGPLGRLLFRRMQDVDRVALARIEARCRGLDERAAVLALAGPAAARRHAAGRRLKALWNRLRGRDRHKGRNP